MSKSELRKNLILKRNSLDSKEEKSTIICCELLDSSIYKSCDKIYLYSSFGSEVDTSLLFSKALSDSKTVAFPKCLDKEGNMEFYYVSSVRDFALGAFGIKEPTTECPKADFDSGTLCIVPGIGFSLDGHRIGYGKGYYDRFLSEFKGISVGFCFDECVIESLPFNKFDKKVNYLITDKKIYNFT